MLKQFQIAKMDYFVDMDICLHSNVEDLIDVDISLRFEDYSDRSKAVLLSSCGSLEHPSPSHALNIQ